MSKPAVHKRRACGLASQQAEEAGKAGLGCGRWKRIKESVVCRREHAGAGHAYAPCDYTFVHLAQTMTPPISSDNV